MPSLKTNDTNKVERPSMCDSIKVHLLYVSFVTLETQAILTEDNFLQFLISKIIAIAHIVIMQSKVSEEMLNISFLTNCFQKIFTLIHQYQNSMSSFVAANILKA